MANIRYAVSLGALAHCHASSVFLNAYKVIRGKFLAIEGFLSLYLSGFSMCYLF
jgi:hypothetical protein